MYKVTAANGVNLEVVPLRVKAPTKNSEKRSNQLRQQSSAYAENRISKSINITFSENLKNCLERLNLLKEDIFSIKKIDSALSEQENLRKELKETLAVDPFKIKTNFHEENHKYREGLFHVRDFTSQYPADIEEGLKHFMEFENKSNKIVEDRKKLVVATKTLVVDVSEHLECIHDGIESYVEDIFEKYETSYEAILNTVSCLAEGDHKNKFCNKKINNAIKKIKSDIDGFKITHSKINDLKKLYKGENSIQEDFNNIVGLIEKSYEVTLKRFIFDKQTIDSIKEFIKMHGKEYGEKCRNLICNLDKFINNSKPESGGIFLSNEHSGRDRIDQLEKFMEHRKGNGLKNEFQKNLEDFEKLQESYKSLKEIEGLYKQSFGDENFKNLEEYAAEINELDSKVKNIVSKKIETKIDSVFKLIKACGDQSKTIDEELFNMIDAIHDASVAHEEPVLSNENGQLLELSQQVDKNTLDIKKIRELQKKITSTESLKSKMADFDKILSDLRENVASELKKIGVEVTNKNNNESLNMAIDKINEKIAENESIMQKLGVDVDLLSKKDSQSKIAERDKLNEINEKIIRLEAENRGLCVKIEEGIKIKEEVNIALQPLAKPRMTAVEKGENKKVDTTTTEVMTTTQTTEQALSLLSQMVYLQQEELELTKRSLDITKRSLDITKQDLDSTKAELGRMNYAVSNLEHRIRHIDGRQTSIVNFLRTNSPEQGGQISTGFSSAPFFQSAPPPHQPSFQVVQPPGQPLQMMQHSQHGQPSQHAWWLRG
jgi:hypothetical protein